jgi:hypothetical protein
MEGNMGIITEKMVIEHVVRLSYKIMDVFLERKSLPDITVDVEMDNERISIFPYSDVKGMKIDYLDLHYFISERFSTLFSSHHEYYKDGEGFSMFMSYEDDIFIDILAETIIFNKDLFEGYLPAEFVQTMYMDDEAFDLWFKLNYGN